MMMAISLQLPDELVEQSTRHASQLGISHAEFIRQALRHEIARVQQQQDQIAMAASFRAMRDHPAYLAESNELDEGFMEILPEDTEEWWTARFC